MRFHLATLLLALGACLTFSTGCHYTPQRTAYVATSTVKYRLRQALAELQKKLASNRTSPAPPPTLSLI